jgi:hypothetical protein
VFDLVLALVVTVPFAPSVDTPAPDAWVVQNGYFSTGAYADDAGVPAASVRLEFRPADGGYGAYEETKPWSRSHYTDVVLPNEGAQWCWRARHINTRGEVSAPSVERCFRTDWTAPSDPGPLDAGLFASTGRVALDFAPATDALSGVKGYALMPGPTPHGDFYWFVDDSPVLPLVTYLGEGTWFGSVRVRDQADNENAVDLSRVVQVLVTANAGLLTPPPPSFESGAMVSHYGDAILWDAGTFASAGVTHVVASYCTLDAGCRWEHGFTGFPVAKGNRSWLQLGEEGAVVARIAVVIGGEVGPWSAPSAPLLLDRTPPPIPPGFTATPLQARSGPHTLSWGLVTDGLTGMSGMVFEQVELLSGAQQELNAADPQTSLLVTPTADGRYQYRVASLDRAGNQSDWSAPIVVTLDGTGPVSMAPVASATPADGGAWVTLTWAAPVDALSAVTGVELQEGATVFAVTGASTQRFVGVGTWTWALRGTDSLGNVGAFSPPSNEVVVTETGVMVMPPPDAGVAGDAGLDDEPRALAVGCGCSTGDLSALSLGLLALAILRRHGLGNRSAA